MLTAISNVFWLCWGRAQGHVAHIGPVLGPTSAPGAHTGPSCACNAQLASKRAQVAPWWPPVGLKLGPSCRQLAGVRRKLSPSWAHAWAKDGQVWPQSALVGPGTSAPFFSIQFSGCGRFSSRSDSDTFFPQELHAVYTTLRPVFTVSLSSCQCFNFVQTSQCLEHNIVSLRSISTLLAVLEISCSFRCIWLAMTCSSGCNISAPTTLCHQQQQCLRSNFVNEDRHDKIKQAQGDADKKENLGIHDPGQEQTFCVCASIKTWTMKAFYQRLRDIWHHPPPSLGFKGQLERNLSPQKETGHWYEAKLCHFPRVNKHLHPIPVPSHANRVVLKPSTLIL